MMKPNLRRVLPIAAVIVLAGSATAWYLLSRNGPSSDGAITASGTVEAVEVIVSPEISGRVTEVLVSQGDSVSSGAPLFRLDGALLQAQRTLAEAGQASAQAALDAARAALDTARTQYQQVLEAALLAEAPVRYADWQPTAPSAFDQPGWYFTKEEQIAALQAEVEAARKALDSAQQELKDLLGDPKYAGVSAAEERLRQARAAYLTAQDVLKGAKASGTDQELIDAAQEQFDAAETELESAQQAFDDLIATDLGQDLRDARARVRAAQERYNAALLRLARLHTGEESYAVKSAAAAVRQADAAVNQAQKAVDQARAQVDWIDAQTGKLTVCAPVDGTILERTIEPGEVAVAGSTALVLGRLDTLTITVYIPEDRYGEIQLGQLVAITVDSFPGRTFSGSVIRIADRAEFTPRNVQTEEGRRTMVFAVQITVADPGMDLKPGMPADVVFE